MYLNKVTFLALSLSLSGCGFEPIYQQKNNVLIPQAFKLNITGSNDQAYTTYKLRRELETLLPTIAQKVSRQLTIKISLEETYGNIAYNANAKAQRSQGQLNAAIQVLDGNLTIIHESKLENATSYTVDYIEEFSNISAEAGARERLIKNLAQDIVHELALIDIKP
ncbi:MAG: hypothetical protein Q8S21_01040 [Candidatus Paracaedibacteraceae bacterium]|nr:hypothetical protein [Candidatus Paracaedibacteraceae bacterium]